MRILIPVDGSTCSRAAVRFIGARSKFMGEKPDVTLLNVQQNIPGTVIEHFSLEAVRSVYEAEGKAIVEKLAPEIEAYGIEPHMAPWGLAVFPPLRASSWVLFPAAC